MDILQKLGLGGQTAVIGIAVVFLLLVILIAIVMLTSKATIPIQKISAWKAGRKAAKDAAKAERAKAKKLAQTQAPAQATKAADIEAIEQKATAPTAAAPESDAELVAVLTAAVAACMGTSTRKVKIASYKRTTRRSAWANAGRAEQIAGRL